MRWVVVIACAAGCFNPTYTDQTHCGPGDECPAGRTCVSGFCLTQTGGHTLTVTVNGSGTVKSTPSGIDCPPTCSASLSGAVVLEAIPDGDNHFRGWEDWCGGADRFCDVDVDGNKTVVANFASIDYNLVFATSEKFQGDFGGLGDADAHCNRLANDAHLTGTWVAFLSNTTTTAISRLGNARGFVRMDGEIIGDTSEDIVTNNRVLRAVRYDENGADIYEDGAAAWTGKFGEVGCSDWTSTSGRAYIGLVNGGPVLWRDTGDEDCAMSFHLYCFLTSKNVTLNPPTTVGKKIYITNGTFTADTGIDAAHALCDAEKPGGVSQVKALLSTSVNSAFGFLVSDAHYVRPDGIFVGTGDDLKGASRAGEARLASGIWQRSDGTYVAEYQVFTGSDALDDAGSASTTCGDWMPGGSQAIGGATVGDGWFWNRTPSLICGAHPVYCAEQ